MLSLHEPEYLRAELGRGLQNYSTNELSWRLGQQAATPSVAFFIGYQAAMRCLNPRLAPTQWAAFLVSEAGVKSPWQMHSYFDLQSGQLHGQKSYAMLVQEGLDCVYIMARQQDTEPTELLLVEVAASKLQVQARQSAAFMAEVPHYAVQFSCVLPKSAVLLTQAHQQANKPFRYWEDVHVLLALAGWMKANLAQPSEALVQAVQGLQSVFRSAPHTYSLVSLSAVEALFSALQMAAAQLPQEQAQQWQKDSQLLMMLQLVWKKIRQRLID